MKPKYVGLLRDWPAYLCDPDKNVLCPKHGCYYLNRGECRLTLNPAFAQAEIKTHADLIRSMSDEELAEFLRRYCRKGWWECGVNAGRDCAKCWLDWLRQEADNGQN